MAASIETFERDVKENEFAFHQLCKFRVFSPTDNSTQTDKRVHNVAVASKYGLIFVAAQNELRMLCFQALSQIDQRLDKRERSTAIFDASCEKSIKVTAPIVHLAVSCDELTLSVVTDDESSLTLLCFDVRSFSAQLTPAPFTSHKLSSSVGCTLNDLSWNPTYPSMLAACVSDSTVTLIDLADSVITVKAKALPVTALSWSPKGKQIMVGKVDGSSSQYDHDLQLKKDWPAPSIFSGPHRVTDILWISTYSFLASYLPPDADSNTQPVVIMTISNKEGNTFFINYDDICFGSGENQQAKYFFQYLLQWEMVVMASGSATEAMVIAKNLDGQGNWEHWNLEDSCRAQLPVTVGDGVDSFPVGLAVLFSSQQVVQLGDNKTHPPCPVLVMLSTDGVLMLYHMTYFHPQALTLTSPPVALTSQGARLPVLGRTQAGGSTSAAAAGQPSTSALAGLLTSPGGAAANRTLPASAGGVKTNLFAAFTAPQATGGTGDSWGKPPLFATPPAGFGQSPQTSQPAKTAAAAPSLLGPRPVAASSAAAAPVTPSSAGFTSTGSGQFAFSYKPPSVATATAVGSSLAAPALTSQQGLPATTVVSAAPTAPASAMTTASGLGTPTASAPRGASQQATPGKPPTTPASPAVRIGNKAGVLTTRAKGNGKDDREIDSILDSTISKNIADEIEDFEKELQHLKERMSRSQLNVGTKEEMQTLMQSSKKMEDFCKEITAVTKEHCHEVYDLKGACIDMFASFEDCRNCHERNRDPQYRRALQKRALDPRSAEHLKRLQQAAQQISQCLADADAILDSQWEAHVEKEKKTRIYVPNSDTVYRAIKSNHNILTNQQLSLERLQDQMRQLQLRNKKSSAWDSFQQLHDGAGASLSSDNLSLRDWQKRKADLLTPEKLTLLKESLANHHVRRVKCQPLTSLAQSRLMSVRCEPRAASVSSADGSTPHGAGASDNEIRSIVVNGSLAGQSSVEGAPAPLFFSTPAGRDVSRFAQPQAPTSFSGVAYFKPQSTKDSGPSVLSATLAQPAFAVEPVSPGSGSVLKNPNMPTVGTSFAVYSSAPTALVSQALYENVTPTEDFNEEEYEDEYAGYEEDEEDEEDEEEAGFGNQYEYFGSDANTVDTSVTAAGGVTGAGVGKILFSAPFSFVQAATPQAPSGSLFGKPATASGAASQSLPSAGLQTSSSVPAASTAAGSVFGSKTMATTNTTTTTSTSSGGLFSFQPSTAAPSDGKSSLLSSGATASSTVSTTSIVSSSAPGKGIFGGSSGSTAASSTTSTPSAVFGGSSSLFGGSGSVFGGSASGGASVFGGSASGGGSVFGSSSPGSTPNFGALLKTPPATAATAVRLSASGDATLTSVDSGRKPEQSSSGLFTSSDFSQPDLAGSGSSTSVTTSSDTSLATTVRGNDKYADVDSASSDTALAQDAALNSTAASTPVVSSAGTGSSKAAASVSVAESAAAAVTGSGLQATESVSTPAAGLFGTAAPAAASITSTAATATVSKSSPLTSSAPATAVPATGFGSTPAGTGGLFGSAVNKSKPTTSLFGGSYASSAAPPAGLFGSAATTTTSTGLFGSAASTTAPTGLFGSAATTTAPSGLFEGSASTTAPTGLFGSATTTSSSSGLFGSAASATAPAGLFGSTSTTTASSGLFGSAAPTTAASTGLFGTTTASSGLFGPASTMPGSTASPAGVFGASTETTTASGSIFGSTAANASAGLFSPATSSTGLFGSPTAAPSSAGLFGANSTTTSGGLFSSAANSTGGTLFGTPATGQSSGGLFGSTQVATGSVFGGQATSSLFGASQASGGSVFGNAASSAQGFGSPASTPSGSLFGAPATSAATGSGFGFGGGPGFGGFSKPAFGSAPTFGQASPSFGQTASGFGQPSSGFGTSTFGQSATSSSDGGLFGGSFGLGAKPSEEKAKQNVFGTVQSFGTSTDNSLFGNKGATSFGSNLQTSGGSGLFGSGGSFSSGTGVAASGFAVTQTSQSSAGGFGTAPTFGSSTAFGGSPAFGSPPVFGNSPEFGSSAPSSGFSSGAAFSSPFGCQPAPSGGAFSGSQPSNFASTGLPTFGSLAQTDAPTFGNLGQTTGGGFGSLPSQGFGSPGFGGQGSGFGTQQQQQGGFGNTSTFGANPSFSSYRG